MHKINEIGLDSGCAFNKAAFLDADQNWVEVSIPSLIRAGRANITMNGAQGYSYVCDGEQWTADENAVDAEDTRFNSFPFSTLNTVLTHHSLAKLAEQHDLAEALDISTGLPLSHYFDFAGANDNEIKRKHEALQKKVEGSSLQVNCKQVCPEGLAGWVDVRIDRHGKAKNGQSHAVAIADIGGRTTDICVVQPDFSLVPEYTSTLNIGCLDIAAEANRLISERYGLGTINLMAMYQVLETGQINLGQGKVQDVTEETRQATKTIAGRITREIERRTGNVPHLEGFCYLGGGAEQLRDFITGDNILVPDRPTFGNARGYLKIMQHMG